MVGELFVTATNVARERTATPVNQVATERFAARIHRIGASFGRCRGEAHGLRCAKSGEPLSVLVSWLWFWSCHHCCSFCWQACLVEGTQKHFLKLLLPPVSATAIEGSSMRRPMEGGGVEMVPFGSVAREGCLIVSYMKID